MEAQDIRNYCMSKHGAYPEQVVRGYHCPSVQQPYWNTIYLKNLPESLLLLYTDTMMWKKSGFAPENMSFTVAEIERQVYFQEQYFKSEIRM